MSDWISSEILSLCSKNDCRIRAKVHQISEFFITRKEFRGFWGWMLFQAPGVFALVTHTNSWQLKYSSLCVLMAFLAKIVLLKHISFGFRGNLVLIRCIKSNPKHSHCSHPQWLSCFPSFAQTSPSPGLLQSLSSFPSPRVDCEIQFSWHFHPLASPPFHSSVTALLCSQKKGGEEVTGSFQLPMKTFSCKRKSECAQRERSSSLLAQLRGK